MRNKIAVPISWNQLQVAWRDKIYTSLMHCKLLWIKAPDKCINVNYKNQNILRYVDLIARNGNTL